MNKQTIVELSDEADNCKRAQRQTDSEQRGFEGGKSPLKDALWFLLLYAENQGGHSSDKHRNEGFGWPKCY